MPKMNIGLFAIEARLDRLTDNGDILQTLDAQVPWTQKNGKNHFGYKNHVAVDVGGKFIRDYKVTNASVHDSNVFEEILDDDNTSRDVYADSAYLSAEHQAELKTWVFARICRGKVAGDIP